MTDDELPKVTVGMPALRRDNPWPELPEDVEPFYLSLDGGGRSLITDLIRDHGVTLMLEVGCFLCGSTRQWLDASADLVIIGVDPWDGNWSVYVRAKVEDGNPMMDTLEDPEATAVTLLRHGNFALALNNIRDQRHRFIPVRQRSPEALHYLRRRQIVPELIYIDALKSDEDLWVAHELFPRSILCGDDWTWRDEDGRFRMREHVEAFAAEKGFDVSAQGASWLVTPKAQRGVPVRPVKRVAWDAEAVAELVDEVDDGALALLRLVASERGDLTFTEASTRLGLTRGETLQAIQRLNDALASFNRVQVLGLGPTEDDGWEHIDARALVLADGLPALLSSG